MKLVLSAVTIGEYPEMIPGYPFENYRNSAYAYIGYPLGASNQILEDVDKLLNKLKKDAHPIIKNYLEGSEYFVNEVKTVDHSPHTPLFVICRRDNKKMEEEDVNKIRGLLTKAIALVNSKKEASSFFKEKRNLNEGHRAHSNHHHP